jgi:glyoxylase-like metal-dependent hydrolase (beta-lactamase superfamily II)
MLARSFRPQLEFNVPCLYHSALSPNRAFIVSEQAAHITELERGIAAIDTDYLRPLFDASHLIVHDGHAAFVDTGINHSVPLLLDALERKNIDTADVDFVFLTHVHLDHAGGAGSLMQHLPNAQAVIHPRGAAHMIDPAKLVAGAEAVYGKDRCREMYGEPVPITADRILVVDDDQSVELRGRPLQCIFTEGHARHHYCLSDPASKGVFTGDSFGVSYRELDTANGEFIFPTTTPIHFDPPEAHKAIDRVMGLQPEALYLTHFSRVMDLPRLADDMHQRIDDFVAIADQHANDNNRTAAMRETMFSYFVEQLNVHGFHADEERIHAILDMDVQLNTMGIEVWLDKTKKRS